MIASSTVVPRTREPSGHAGQIDVRSSGREHTVTDFLDLRRRDDDLPFLIPALERRELSRPFAGLDGGRQTQEEDGEDCSQKPQLVFAPHSVY